MAVSFRASAIGTGSSVTGPASIVAGDVLSYLDIANSVGSFPTAVTPSGFTNIVNLTHADGLAIGFARAMWSIKIATGAEASAAITGMDGDQDDRKILLVFNPGGTLQSIAMQDLATEATDGNPAAQTINASGSLKALIALTNYYTVFGGTVNPRTHSPAADAEVSNSNCCWSKYKIYNSSPADVTVDMDDEGVTNLLMSGYLELTFPRGILFPRRPTRWFTRKG